MQRCVRENLGCVSLGYIGGVLECHWSLGKILCLEDFKFSLASRFLAPSLAAGEQRLQAFALL